MTKEQSCVGVLCRLGALLNAVRLILRGWDDVRLAQHLYDKFAVGALPDYKRVVELAHAGVDAARQIRELKAGQSAASIHIPDLPR